MSRLRGAFPYLLVFTVACAMYAQTLGFGFAGDDIGIIRDRALFHDLGRWREILTAPWWPQGLYRPLTALTLAANWAVAAGDPRSFHLVNLLLHAVASLLVYQLARGLMPEAAAIVAGLLFAVHPVHVEAVANLVGRAEVLAAVFAVSAVLLYRWDGQLVGAGYARSWRRCAAAFGTLAAVALALGSKESAFALPALFLLVDWYEGAIQGRRAGDAVARHGLLWLAPVAVTLGWLTLRAGIVHDLTGLEVAPGLEDRGLTDRTAIMLPIALQYARLLFFPARLSVEYSPNFLPVTTALTARSLLGAGLVAAGIGVALAARRRAPVLTLGIGWLGATLLIVSNVLVPTGVLLAERTLYLPSVGAVLLGAWLWGELRRRTPAPAMAGALVVLAGAALRTATRNPIWRDDTTYYPAMVRDAPGSFRADWTAAELARQRGDLRGAETYLRRAVQTHPLAWNAWRDLARLMYLEGRYAEAAHYFWAAWRITGWSASDAQLAIQSHLQAGRVDSAEALLSTALATRPDQPPPLTLAAGDVALARGQFLRAMTLRRQVAWIYPDSARLWALVGDAAAHAGQCPEVLHSLGSLRQLPSGSDYARTLDAEAVRLGCR